MNLMKYTKNVWESILGQLIDLNGAKEEDFNFITVKDLETLYTYFKFAIIDYDRCKDSRSVRFVTSMEISVDPQDRKLIKLLRGVEIVSEQNRPLHEDGPFTMTGKYLERMLEQKFFDIRGDFKACINYLNEISDYSPVQAHGASRD